MPTLTLSIIKHFLYLTLTLAFAGCGGGRESDSDSSLEEQQESQALPLKERGLPSSETYSNEGTEIPAYMGRSGEFNDHEVTAMERISSAVAADSARVDIPPLPLNDSGENGGLKPSSGSDLKQDDRLLSNEMHEVTKAEFRNMYFRYGTEENGWSVAYWNRFYEPEPRRPMRYMLKFPQSAKHMRMMIVTSYSQNEYRMFFLTEEEEDRLFGP